MQKWRIKRYNRTKRPWRSRRFLRAAVRRYVGLPVSTSAERKRCLLRSCLCCMTLAELIVIGITDPAIFAEAKHLFDINWSTERSVEQAGFEEEVSPYPSDRTDSGYDRCKGGKGGILAHGGKGPAGRRGKHRPVKDEILLLRDKCMKTFI